MAPGPLPSDLMATDETALSSRRTADQLEGEWSVVEPKTLKRRKIQAEATEATSGYPAISFLDSKPVRVPIKALQDLVLYVLDDGVAPTWLALQSGKHIRKVVVVMIPGLDRAILEDPGILSELQNSSDESQPVNPASALGEPEKQAHEVEEVGSVHHLDVARTPDTQPAGSRSLLRNLLANIIEAKAPGDSRTNRVHSPLQAMLIVPLGEAKDKKTSSSATEKSFQAVRTPVAKFIHTVEDLREAEYPIHPAAFHDARDADLERQRRAATGQSTSAGWVDTAVALPDPPLQPSPPQSQDFLTQGLKPYALDCEMVQTSDEQFSLARISLVDWQGKTVLDEYVKPSLPITNYFTQYSGITPAHLANVTTTLQDIQKRLCSILGADTVLLGHSLESDLNALKLTHPFIIDTSMIYPHPRGLPLRSSLKFLANRYLRREIQKGGASGHDSVEDAVAVLDLVRLKCEKGPRWGTLDANGESIFRRLARSPASPMADCTPRNIQTAIVEYGTPEKGFGKEATYKIACSNDHEVVRGVLRAAHGGPTSASTANGDGKIEGEPASAQHIRAEGQEASEIPAGGVDFVWSRLRDLEQVREWNAPPPPLPDTNASTSLQEDLPSSSPPNLHEVATRTVRNVLDIYSSLPPRTLLVVYSGTSDMRPVLRLQQLHAQYKREFKVKKWDELSVKWTDTEQQQLKHAVEDARRGVGILAIR